MYVQVSYRVVYDVSWSAFARDFVAACCVLGVAGLALAVYWLVNWQVRANRPELDAVVVAKFLVAGAGFVGSALFAVVYVTSVCWTLFYKVVGRQHARQY